MSTVDMRAASAAREPREFFEMSVDIGLALEGDQPPLALAQGEVDGVVGRPPQNLETGEGYEPGFAGVRYYHREHSRLRARGRYGVRACGDPPIGGTGMTDLKCPTCGLPRDLRERQITMPDGRSMDEHMREWRDAPMTLSRLGCWWRGGHVGDGYGSCRYCGKRAS